MQSDRFLLIKKIKQIQPTNHPVWGKRGQLATSCGRARQDRAGYHQGNINDELAQDCKPKEIIKRANKESNEINTGGAN